MSSFYRFSVDMFIGVIVGFVICLFCYLFVSFCFVKLKTIRNYLIVLLPK